MFPLIIGELLNTFMGEYTGCSLILASMSRDDIAVLLLYLNSCFPEGMIKFILHLVSYSSRHLQELVGIINNAAFLCLFLTDANQHHVLYAYIKGI